MVSKRPPPDGSLANHEVAYLLGIGGVGMSAGAELLLERGLRVSGSDREATDRVHRLRSLGVPVDLDEEAALLPADADLVVASSAIAPAHPQLAEACRRGIEVWKYADLVGALLSDRRAVCVAGTHGKTTTTALIAFGLAHGGRDPSFLVGGDVLGLVGGDVLGRRLEGCTGGARAGRGAHFVVEACEYDRSFHHYRPSIAVITNVDEDHLDYYRDLGEIQEAFRVFAAGIRPGGTLVVHEPSADLFRTDPRIEARIVTYGFEPTADWRVKAPSRCKEGNGTEGNGTEGNGTEGNRTSFELAHGRGSLGRFEVALLGHHNLLNAAGACATMDACGLLPNEIRAGLRAFAGVGRRLELVAERGGVLVFDDYGHHPAEIRATLEAMRERYTDERMVLVFQPHQASRTRQMLAEFADALVAADEVWLPPIYYARDTEEDRRCVSSEDLARAVRERGGAVRTFPDLPAVVTHGVSNLGRGDVAVTMGAGDVDEVARGLADRLP